MANLATDQELLRPFWIEVAGFEGHTSQRCSEVASNRLIKSIGRQDSKLLVSICVREGLGLAKYYGTSAGVAWRDRWLLAFRNLVEDPSHIHGWLEFANPGNSSVLEGWVSELQGYLVKAKAQSALAAAEDQSKTADSQSTSNRPTISSIPGGAKR